MATPDSLAKTAREKLAQALNALQSAPDAPVFVLELAEPIAQSMALLHKIERSRGADLAGKDIVAANVRLVLDKLQAATESHATIDQMMECIAGSLASVHQLARSTPVAAAPVAAAPPAPPAATAPGIQPALSGAGTHILSPQQGQQVMQAAQAVIAQNAAPPGFPAPPTFAAAAPGIPSSQPAFAAAQPAAPPAGARPANQTVRMDQSPVAAAQQQAAAQQHAAQQHAAQQQAAQQHAQQQQQAAQQHAAQQAAQQQAARPQAAAVARPAAPTPAASQPGGNVLVELGAHSNSNFYKGLGGNDVIEHGGLFVATYKIPKLGTQVNLRVLLPGDYEFQATGVVQWLREPQGGEVDPGFGARLTQITPEGRQLVYRYTRNREPIFYDDL